MSWPIGPNKMHWLICSLVEADARNFSAHFDAPKTLKPDGLPGQKCFAYIEDASNLDTYFHLDISLSYDSSSDIDTFSSFGPTAFDSVDDTLHNCGVGRQAIDLRGVGQWTNQLQSSVWGSWQGSSTSMDDAEDTVLDLTRVHTLAYTCPFEQYFHTRKDEEGALTFQVYSSLP